MYTLNEALARERMQHVRRRAEHARTAHELRSAQRWRWLRRAHSAQARSTADYELVG